MMGLLLSLWVSLLAGYATAGGVGDGVEKRERKVLAFYYPWYGAPEGPGGTSRGSKYVHWEGVETASKRIASSTNYPVLGAYDSMDVKTIDAHCEMLSKAGIDGVVVSWWGKGSYEDAALSPLLEGCAKFGLQLAVYFEQVERPVNAASAAAGIKEVLGRVSGHRAYMTVEEHGIKRPVLFVYGRALGQLGPKGWKEVVAQVHQDGKQPFLVCDSFEDAMLSMFDGGHCYGPAGDVAAAGKKGEAPEVWAKRAIPWWVGQARKLGKLGCVTVFPGYDDRKIRTPGLFVDRAEGALYDMLWREAIAAEADWVLITSFNEWHEGSEIEPSVELGDRYMRATRDWAERFKSSRDTGK